MALELKKEDLAKTGSISPSKNVDSFGGMITGTDQIMGKVISGINALGNTAEQFGKLFDRFSDLKDKLPGQQKVSQSPSAPMRQPAAPVYVERAEQPTTPQQSTTEEKPMTEDKTEKAKRIFDELHGLIKPYLPMAGTVSALQVIQMAMQPKNKEKIIQEIAKRL